MTEKKFADPAHVVLGDSTVSIKRSGQSAVVIANILGRANDEEGNLRVLWLDRIVHREGDLFEGWEATGAISTVLTKEMTTATA